MALASAVATLLAALFVCLGVGDPTPTPAPAPVDAHQGSPRAQHAVAPAHEYVCPYGRGRCSLFPSLGPAVLAAPPLGPPHHAEGRLPGPVPAYDTGRVSRSGAQPRAPDLHVLQVLRT